MSTKKVRKRAPLKRRERENYEFIGLSAEGTFGSPLGFGDFMRRLPDSVIQHAARDKSVLFMIGLYARLIVLGDRNAGVPQEFFTEEAMKRLSWCIINEHLRRMLMMRVRYPRDPFSETPQLAWWNAHPFVRIIQELPEDQADRLKSHILRTGDTTVLSGHIVALSAEAQANFDRDMTLIDAKAAEMLAEIEDAYADSRTLAWAGDDMRG